MLAFIPIIFGILASLQFAFGCEIDLDERNGKYVPFMLKDGVIARPINGRVLQLADGEILSLFCHGTEERFNRLSMASLGISSVNVPKLDLTCNGGEMYYDTAVVSKGSIYAATCTRVMEPEIIREENSNCDQGLESTSEAANNGIVLVRIGWNFGLGFQEQILACIDENNYNTLWTKHRILGDVIDFNDDTPGRPSFRTDNRGYKRFFTFDYAKYIDDAYSKNSQAEVIATLLGNNNMLPDGTPLIETSTSGTNYCAKGHLSPDADFIEGSEQDATYFFFNVAPQFQSFNNGNWKYLEYAARHYASISGNVTVWTGTHEVLTYPDVNGNQVPIYLYIKDDHRYIPVPKYIWKVLQNEATEEVVAFVGLNDPHSDDITAENAFCSSICSSIIGVDWDLGDESKGNMIWAVASAMICCSLEELKSKIAFVPDLSGSPQETNIDN